MSLHHADIWKAIDRLAERHGLSPSALARLAGLSPTVFNPSKRISAQRKRWPSTESIAQILQATNTSLDDFVGLTMLVAYRHTLPLLAFSSVSKDGFFDERGYPTGMGWKEIRFPGLEDPHAFALEMNDQGMEPLYRQGDCLILSPLERARQGDRIVLKMKNKDIFIRQQGRETPQTLELISLIESGPSLTVFIRDIAWKYRILWVGQTSGADASKIDLPTPRMGQKL